MVGNARLMQMGVLPFFRLYPLLQLTGAGGPAPTIKDGAVLGRSVNKTCRIVHGRIARVIQYQHQTLAHESGLARAVEMQIVVPPGMPFFYLPYEDNKSTRVTLVDRQGIGNVNLFLTDVVDGCSIYVEGSRTSPTVYHINAKATGRVLSMWSNIMWSRQAKLLADREARYARMDHQFRHEVKHPASVTRATVALPAPTKLEARDYLDRPFDFDDFLAQGKIPGVSASGDRVEGAEVLATQGTIFGACDAVTGAWTFYVQRRAWIAHRTRLNPDPIGFQWIVMSVDEFWPNPTTGRYVP